MAKAPIRLDCWTDNTSPYLSKSYIILYFFDNNFSRRSSQKKSLSPDTQNSDEKNNSK